uniref:Uncharacterized protein n=1 Tax=Medicago truncatula TaxID=3880 RepID=I3T3C2_MEDTR|nr:unknown [Medicago truncatula]
MLAKFWRTTRRWANVEYLLVSFLRGSSPCMLSFSHLWQKQKQLHRCLKNSLFRMSGWSRNLSKVCRLDKTGMQGLRLSN